MEPTIVPSGDTRYHAFINAVKQDLIRGDADTHYFDDLCDRDKYYFAKNFSKLFKDAPFVIACSNYQTVGITFTDCGRCMYYDLNAAIIFKSSPTYQALFKRFAREVYAIVKLLPENQSKYLEVLRDESSMRQWLTTNHFNGMLELNTKIFADSDSFWDTMFVCDHRQCTFSECTCNAYKLIRGSRLSVSQLFSDTQTELMQHIRDNVTKCPCCTWFLVCFGLVEEIRDDFPAFVKGEYFDNCFARYLSNLSYITPVDFTVMMKDARLSAFAKTIYQSCESTFGLFALSQYSRYKRLNA
jgi:hypothetical protein